MVQDKFFAAITQELTRDHARHIAYKLSPLSQSERERKIDEMRTIFTKPDEKMLIDLTIQELKNIDLLDAAPRNSLKKYVATLKPGYG